jgi:hypothetical protein
MKKQTFLDGIDEIYAHFGKAMPSERILKAAFDSVCELPDAFMAYAVGALCDYEKFPANPGRELRLVLWGEYLGKNPELAARREEIPGCKNCRNSPAGPGYYFATDNDGYRVLLRCVCNDSPGVAKWPAWTPDKAFYAGLTLEPDRTFEASYPDEPLGRAVIVAMIRLGKTDLRAAEFFSLDDWRDRDDLARELLGDDYPADGKIRADRPSASTGRNPPGRTGRASERSAGDMLAGDIVSLGQKSVEEYRRRDRQADF